MIKMGAILLIFETLLQVLMSVYMSFPISFPIPEIADILDSVFYDVAYLASFMLPALFLPLFFQASERQPKRLSPKLSGSTIAFIFAGVTCVFAFSYINSIVCSTIFGEINAVEDMFVYAPTYTSDYGVVLQFITIALVPAFCEEFLFRGVVLSNLMPYGKSTAIIVSAVCFGLMHSNFQQFLYATVAGIVLGVVYVLTDSIWPSTIIHMINNALSVLQLVLFERMEESYAVIAWVAVNCIVFVLGIISAVYLIKKYRSKEQVKESVFDKPLHMSYENEDAALCGNANLPAKDAIRLFFTPTMLAFVIYCIAIAFLSLIPMSMYE